MKTNIVYVTVILIGVLLSMQPFFANVATTNSASIGGAIIFAVGGYFLHRNITAPQN